LTTTTSYMQQGKKESNARFRTNTGWKISHVVKEVCWVLDIKFINHLKQMLGISVP
jgi:hypothetical protein